jgi:hypothetical protein
VQVLYRSKIMGPRDYKWDSYRLSPSVESSRFEYLLRDIEFGSGMLNLHFFNCDCNCSEPHSYLSDVCAPARGGRQLEKRKI